MKARQQLRPIYDAAWELCRIGVLRPGRGVQRSCSSRHRGPPGDVAAREHAFPVGAVGLGRALASSRQVDASKNKSTAGGRMRAAWVKITCNDPDMAMRYGSTAPA